LIDNLLVRIHFIIVMIRWTGLAPWDAQGVRPACEDRIGTGPPRARTQVIYVDLHK